MHESRVVTLAQAYLAHRLLGPGMLQAGGALFDGQERLVMHSEMNARVLATVVSWTTGPNRIAVNAPEFDAAGNKMRLDGSVLFSFMSPG